MRRSAPDTGFRWFAATRRAIGHYYPKWKEASLCGRLKRRPLPAIPTMGAHPCYYCSARLRRPGAA